MPKRSAKLSPSIVELDGPFQHGHVHTCGLRLHTVSAGSVSDPLIVLLHGAFGGWFEYRHIIADLADAGYHVVAVDLRGYGMSDHPPVTAGQDIRSDSGQISGLITALGYESAYIIGYDIGGALGWALASKSPQQVDGFISVASAHPVDLRKTVQTQPWNFLWILLRAALMRLPSCVYLPFPRRFEWLYRRNLSSETTAEFTDSQAFADELHLRVQASKIGRSRAVALQHNRHLLSFAPGSWLDQPISVPVTMLHAEQSLWKRLTARSAQRMHAPWKALTLQGSKNMPHIEKPQAFARMVIQQIEEWRSAKNAASRTSVSAASAAHDNH